MDRAHHPAGVALVEAWGENLRYRVVLRLVFAGDHADHAMSAALEGIAGFGREDLYAAPVQDLFHIVGEGTYQPPILPGQVESAGFLAQLAVKPDQVGRHGLEDEPSHPVPQPLVLLVQPVDNCFPVRGSPVELSQMVFYLDEAPDQMAE